MDFEEKYAYYPPRLEMSDLLEKINWLEGLIKDSSDKKRIKKYKGWIKEYNERIKKIRTRMEINNGK